jgi:hypothetical protein
VIQTSNKKTRVKRSRIWTMPKDEFAQLVASSQTYVEILRAINYTIRGGAFRILKERIATEMIDDSHILKNGRQTIYAHRFNTRSDDDIFCENSTYNSGPALKKRMIKLGLPEECTKCGLGATWNDEPLSLQVDHINGVRNDNRLENLRLLCPNCHSQTENFAGRKLNAKNKSCPECCAKISGYRKDQRCQSCANKIRSREMQLISKPSKDELQDMLWKMPATRIAKIYNVSDKTVGNWAKSYKIDKPSRGHWVKKNTPPPL